MFTSVCQYYSGTSLSLYLHVGKYLYSLTVAVSFSRLAASIASYKLYSSFFVHLKRLQSHPFVNILKLMYNAYSLNQNTVSIAKQLASLILYIILSIALKLHVYGTRSTMYMYVWSKQMLTLYFKNLLFLFLVNF